MFLVSVIGIGNTIGRIVCGLASSLPGVNALVLNNVFISVGGLLTMFSGLSMTEGYQFFYAAGFGLSICKWDIIQMRVHISFLNFRHKSLSFSLAGTHSYRADLLYDVFALRFFALDR